MNSSKRTAIILGFIAFSSTALGQVTHPVDWQRELGWDALLFSIAIGAEVGGRLDREDPGNRDFPTSNGDDWIRTRIHGEEKSADTSAKEGRADLASDLTLNSEIALAALVPLFSSNPTANWQLAVTIRAFALQTATSSSLKHIIRRQRPKAYYNDDYDTNIQSRVSFPSGHSAAAFCAASVLSQLNPHWPWAAHLGLYSLAATTAVLRIVADRHFFSDTVAGSLIGAGAGTSAVYWGEQEPGTNDVRIGFTGNAFLLQKEF